MKKSSLYILGLMTSMTLGLSSTASAAMPEFLRSSQELMRSDAPVAGKKTVCTITLNSSNERNLFEKKLDKSQFQFVELTLVDQWAPRTDSSKNWFERSCDSNIQCDMLIISGHFGGVFFGSTGKSLSFEELENRSCRKSCNGILSNPKEVFLFGCNTLSTKEADSRSREQYIQVLLEEVDEVTGRRLYTQNEAEAVAEARYGATGEQNLDRMRRIFLNVPYIYGFKTKAPLGYAIAPALSKYIDAALPYETHLTNLTASGNTANTVQNELLNTHLKNIPHKGLYQCAGLSGLNQNDPYYEVNLNMCKFYNLIENDAEKIKFIYKLLRQTSNPNLYLPPVIDLLVKNSKLINSSAANLLRKSPEIKSLYTNLLKDIITPVIKSQWLVVGRKLDWLTTAEYQAAAVEVYGKILNGKITNETAAAVSSLSFKVPGNPPVNMDEVAALLKPVHFTNIPAIETIYHSGLLKSEATQVLLEAAVQDGIAGKNKFLSALIGILDMKGLTLNARLSSILSQATPSCLSNASMTPSCIVAFSNLDATNSTIVNLAQKAIADKAENALNAISFLGKTKNKYQGSEMDIMNLLALAKGNQIRSYGDYFVQFPPTSAEAKNIIVAKALEDLKASYDLVKALKSVQIDNDKFVALVKAQHAGQGVYDTWDVLLGTAKNQTNFTVEMAQELFKKPIKMNGVSGISFGIKNLMDNTSFQDAILQDATALNNLCLSAADSSTLGGNIAWNCFDKMMSWRGVRGNAAAKSVAQQFTSEEARKFLSKIK